MGIDLNKPTTPTDTSGNQTINRDNQRGIVVGDGATDYVLVGFQKDGFGEGVDYGIKSTPPGVDVKTATDDQLAFSSAFKNLKIVDTGTATMGALSFSSPGAGLYDTNSVEAEVTHDLGYVPIVFAFLDSGGSTYSPLPSSDVTANTSSQVTWQNYSVLSTSSLIRFTLTATTMGTSYSRSSFTIKYYLMRETAN